MNINPPNTTGVTRRSTQNVKNDSSSKIEGRKQSKAASEECIEDVNEDPMSYMTMSDKQGE